MTLSPLGLALIAFFEDFRLIAYRKFPNEPWTCGYGHTGLDVIQGTMCTPTQARAWLLSDTGKASDAVRQKVKAVLTQHQFDALVSLVYNTGSVALQHRTGGVWLDSALLERVNAGDHTGAAEQFLAWDHVNGEPSAGLLRRRELEAALYLDT